MPFVLNSAPSVSISKFFVSYNQARTTEVDPDWTLLETNLCQRQNKHVILNHVFVCGILVVPAAFGFRQLWDPKSHKSTMSTAASNMC